MKKLFTTLALSASALTVAFAQQIVVGTSQTDLVLRVGPNNRLYQVYLGQKLLNPSDYDRLPWDVYAASDGSVSQRGWEAYNTAGSEEFYEPALGVIHADGNRTTYLYYVDHSQHTADGITETIIHLADDQYPVAVTLHYEAFERENVIKVWTEISHSGVGRKVKPVTLFRYASSMLYFKRPSYFLTEFHSDWAKEAQMCSQELQEGKKVLDTKLGSRQNMHMQPMFELGLGAPVSEQHGEVLMGTLGWTGNWQFTFEVDNVHNLRVLSGINPWASEYELKAGETFQTPEFIFTLSQQGTSLGSRNLHAWALKHQLKDGDKGRMSLLNNWENTYFDFDQEKLAGLMKEAKTLGVDLFLLDDGWFGNGEHARNGDTAGLGDWEVNHAKLPGGIPALCDAADAAGVKFGIWIEPEMVNPKSDLYVKHPDWVIELPNRQTYYYRNQLVLDLSNPQVQEHVYSVVANILTENPRVKYFKWDCNSPITNVYSPIAGSKQGQLYINYVRGLYNVLQRIRQDFPQSTMMLCSGGGGRGDYEALKYFTEFWCSDDTDPVERLYIQWGFSQFFPAKAMCAHVTDWNRNTSMKFRTDVASMCKLGFDIGLHHINDQELGYLKTAVANWHRLQPVILDGTQYRLVSPYQGNHMAVNYVSADRSHAVLFAYDIHTRYKEVLQNVCLEGLDPQAQYRIEEINLMPGQKSLLPEHGQTLSGDYLMKVGIQAFTQEPLRSRVIELHRL